MIADLLVSAWGFIVWVFQCFCLGLMVVVPAICAFAPLIDTDLDSTRPKR